MVIESIAADINVNIDLQIILGLIAAAIGVLCYLFYFHALYKKTARPHLFSWLIWTILTAVGFFAQVTDGGGPGAWVTGISAAFCAVIVIFAALVGDKERTRSDWATFIAALAAIPLWLITDNPLYSVILITIIDALGFYPTFRKSYFKPFEEPVSSYLLAGTKFVFGIAALTHFSVVTVLYVGSLVVMNFLFVIMVLWRRKALLRESVS